MKIEIDRVSFENLKLSRVSHDVFYEPFCELLIFLSESRTGTRGPSPPAGRCRYACVVCYGKGVVLKPAGGTVTYLPDTSYDTKRCSATTQATTTHNRRSRSVRSTRDKRQERDKRARNRNTGYK